MGYSSDGGKTYQKLSMSKNYKSNAFKKGGEIVNYMKGVISELKKYEVGKFETINTKGMDEFEGIYKIRELNISAEQLNKFLEKNSGENYYDAYGDKQKIIAFSIYKDRSPIAIAYFSRYNSNSLTFTAIGQGDNTTTGHNDFTKAILKKFKKDKEFKNIFIRRLEREKKREEKNAWKDETMTFRGPQPYIFDRLPIPKPLNYFFKPITMDVEKNAYDNTDKFIGFIK